MSKNKQIRNSDLGKRVIETKKKFNTVLLKNTQSTIEFYDLMHEVIELRCIKHAVYRNNISNKPIVIEKDKALTKLFSESPRNTQEDRLKLNAKLNYLFHRLDKAFDIVSNFEIILSNYQGSMNEKEFNERRQLAYKKIKNKVSPALRKHLLEVMTKPTNIKNVMVTHALESSHTHQTGSWLWGRDDLHI